MDSKGNTLLSIHNPLGWLYDLPYFGIDSGDEYYLLNESNQSFIMKRESHLLGKVVWCDVVSHDISFYRCTKREKQITGKNIKGPFHTLEQAKKANTNVFLTNHQFNVPPYFIPHVPKQSISSQKTKPFQENAQPKRKLPLEFMESVYQKEKELRVEYWSSLLDIVQNELERL
jgi:hypothetical protein